MLQRLSGPTWMELCRIHNAVCDVHATSNQHATSKRDPSEQKITKIVPFVNDAATKASPSPK